MNPPLNRAMRLTLVLGMAPLPAMWPKGIFGFPGDIKLYIMSTSPSNLFSSFAQGICDSCYRHPG